MAERGATRSLVVRALRARGTDGVKQLGDRARCARHAPRASAPRPGASIASGTLVGRRTPARVRVASRRRRLSDAVGGRRARRAREPRARRPPGAATPPPRRGPTAPTPAAFVRARKRRGELARALVAHGDETRRDGASAARRRELAVAARRSTRRRSRSPPTMPVASRAKARRRTSSRGTGGAPRTFGHFRPKALERSVARRLIAALPSCAARPGVEDATADDRTPAACQAHVEPRTALTAGRRRARCASSRRLRRAAHGSVRWARARGSRGGGRAARSLRARAAARPPSARARARRSRTRMAICVRIGRGGEGAAIARRGIECLSTRE